MSHRKMLLKVLLKKKNSVMLRENSIWNSGKLVNTFTVGQKCFVFNRRESGGYCVLCYGLLTAVDILGDKYILLNRMFNYKTFVKYVSEEKYYQKFCKKKSSVMLKNSGKLLNKFTAGQNCFVFNRRESGWYWYSNTNPRKYLCLLVVQSVVPKSSEKLLKRHIKFELRL